MEKLDRRKILFVWACCILAWPIVILAAVQIPHAWVAVPLLMITQVGILYRLYEPERQN